jgi:hypothetical protein
VWLVRRRVGGGQRAGGGNSAKKEKLSCQGSVLAGGMQWRA